MSTFPDLHGEHGCVFHGHLSYMVIIGSLCIAPGRFPNLNVFIKSFMFSFHAFPKLLVCFIVILHITC